MDQNRSQVAGIVLVVLGGLLLLGQGLDMGEFAWPLFIIVPGLVLVGGAIWEAKRFSVLAIPGSIVSAVGLILLVQNATGRFESWAYAWALLLVAIGIGQVIQGTPTNKEAAMKSGLGTVRVGLILFAVFAVFFEFFIFGEGLNTVLGRYILPLLLVGAGAFILAQPQLFSRSKELS